MILITRTWNNPLYLWVHDYTPGQGAALSSGVYCECSQAQHKAIPTIALEQRGVPNEQEDSVTTEPYSSYVDITEESTSTLFIETVDTLLDTQSSDDTDTDEEQAVGGSPPLQLDLEFIELELT